jgi:hypothetical protein
LFKHLHGRFPKRQPQQLGRDPKTGAKVEVKTVFEFVCPRQFHRSVVFFLFLFLGLQCSVTVCSCVAPPTSTTTFVSVVLVGRCDVFL